LNGDLWIADVGQNTREEVNRQLASSIGGENYGWKVMEGTFCHDPDPVDIDCPALTPSCFDASYTPPLFEYANLGWATDACSVTGGFVYRGVAIAGLQGAYVFGDFCGGFVWALEETSPGVWTRSELARLSLGLTSFGEDAGGELYVTHNDDVYRVVPEPTSWLMLVAGTTFLGLLYRRRARTFPPAPVWKLSVWRGPRAGSMGPQSSSGFSSQLGFLEPDRAGSRVNQVGGGARRAS